MGRPKENRERVVWNLDAELVEKAREVAKKRGITLQMILQPIMTKTMRELIEQGE
jgi:predicted urease superfamily metal-dependent hydrolase